MLMYVVLGITFIYLVVILYLHLRHEMQDSRYREK
jgi:hypothetical protein